MPGHSNILQFNLSLVQCHATSGALNRFHPPPAFSAERYVSAFGNSCLSASRNILTAAENIAFNGHLS